MIRGRAQIEVQCKHCYARRRFTGRTYAVCRSKAAAAGWRLRRLDRTDLCPGCTNREFDLQTKHARSTS